MLKKLTITLLGCLAVSVCNAAPADKGATPTAINATTANPSAEKGQIKSFHYGTNGMSMYHCTSLDIKRNEAGIPYLRATYTNDDGRVETVLKADEDLIKGLQALVKQYNISEWNGYKHANSDVLDANGFGLSVHYADGTSISAEGYAAAPKGLGEFQKALFKFRDQMIQKYSRNTPAIIQSDTIKHLSFSDQTIANGRPDYAFGYSLNKYGNGTDNLIKWTGTTQNNDRHTYQIPADARVQLTRLIKQEKLKAKEKQHTTTGDKTREIELAAEFEPVSQTDLPEYWEGPEEHLSLHFKPNDPQYLKLKKKIIGILIRIKSHFYT